MLLNEISGQDNSHHNKKLRSQTKNRDTGEEINASHGFRVVFSERPKMCQERGFTKIQMKSFSKQLLIYLSIIDNLNVPTLNQLLLVILTT